MINSYNHPSDGVKYTTKEVNYNELISRNQLLSVEFIDETDKKAKEQGFSVMTLPLGVKVHLEPNQEDIYVDEIYTHFRLKNFPHQTNSNE